MTNDAIRSPWGDDHVTPIPIPQIIFRNGDDPFFGYHQLSRSGLGQNFRSVFEALETLWAITQDVDSIKTSTILGEPLEFWLADHQVSCDDLSDAQVAIAKFEYMSEWWITLTSHDCWRGVSTFPPSAILSDLIGAQISGVGLIARLNLNAGSESHAVSDFISSSIKKMISVLNPSIEVFFSSIRVYEQSISLTSPDDSSGDASGPIPKSRITVNAQMIDKIQKDPAATYWTVREWSAFISCSPAAIHKTKMWKTLRRLHAESKVDRSSYHKGESVAEIEDEIE